MTQPVYELAAWERFLERLGGVPGIPILVGILPLQSFRHAEFLHNEVPGIQVPDWIRARMHDGRQRRRSRPASSWRATCSPAVAPARPAST